MVTSHITVGIPAAFTAAATFSWSAGSETISQVSPSSFRSSPPCSSTMSINCSSVAASFSMAISPFLWNMKRRQRMTEDMQVRNLALNTQTCYVQQVSLFARHFHKSPEQLGPEDIRTYQVYLTNEKKLAPGSILIAVSALRFLYKVSLKKDWTFADVIPAPKKPQTLPIVLSPEEVLQFLDCVGSAKHRPILTA